MENKKIEFHCSKCNKRLFDYIAGDMCVEIEMKCERCKRVMRLCEGLFYYHKLIRKE